MSTEIVSTQEPAFEARNNINSATTAFLAIVRRDLLVIRREALTFLVQMLIQPLFYLFIFGKVLPDIGAATTGFATLLLPGVVAITVFMTTLQGPSVELARDLGFTREIEDRLLSPLPIALVAIEKIALSALRGLVAGAVVFPLAYWVLGSEYQVRTDRIGLLIGLMVLIALVGSALGTLLASLAPVHLLPLVFALVLTPLVFTGCAFYPWASLDGLKWFQVVTLFNPLTYASEGLRYAMVPPLQGATLETLAINWVLIFLSAALVVCLAGGIWLFHRRVVD